MISGDRFRLLVFTDTIPELEQPEIGMQLCRTLASCELQHNL